MIREILEGNIYTMQDTRMTPIYKYIEIAHSKMGAVEDNLGEFKDKKLENMVKKSTKDIKDIMQYIQEKVIAIKNTGELDKDITGIYYESRLNDLKSRLTQFNESLDDKIEDVRKMKRELKGLHDSLED